MSPESPDHPAWNARGLLFENCSCTAVCPGHIHFDQLCTHERCLGYWAMRFDDGTYDGVDLAGARAVVAYDTPQHMIEGNWTETLILDADTSPEQRAALESILQGRAGGPWAVLARFVSRWLPTRHLPIRFVDDDTAKAVAIDGLLDSRIEAIRGRDRDRPVTFENIYNQIHAPAQVIATGSTRYDDGTIVVNNQGTHGLWSRFDWVVPASAA